jgi:hypothetical protein
MSFAIPFTPAHQVFTNLVPFIYVQLFSQYCQGNDTNIRIEIILKFLTDLVGIVTSMMTNISILLRHWPSNASTDATIGEFATKYCVGIMFACQMHSKQFIFPIECCMQPAFSVSG